MNISVIKEQEAVTSVWSGGTSKQYYIFPPDSTYAARDFSFRISVAVSTNADSSPYSHLPGIMRHLVMLDGVAEVVHDGRPPLTLTPYGVIDVFDGSIESSGKGCVTDLNLMTGGDADGVMEVMTQSGVISPKNSPKSGKAADCIALFCGEGEVRVQAGEEKPLSIFAGELLVAENIGKSKLAISHDNAKIIRMDVWLAI